MVIKKFIINTSLPPQVYIGMYTYNLSQKSSAAKPFSLALSFSECPAKYIHLSRGSYVFPKQTMVENKNTYHIKPAMVYQRLIHFT